MSIANRAGVRGEATACVGCHVQRMGRHQSERAPTVMQSTFGGRKGEENPNDQVTSGFGRALLASPCKPLFGGTRARKTLLRVAHFGLDPPLAMFLQSCPWW